MNKQFYLDLVKQVPAKHRRLVVQNKDGEATLDLTNFIVAYGKAVEKYLRKTNAIDRRTTKSL
jgi:hypothetical protein